jgi:hypothetical protein
VAHHDEAQILAIRRRSGSLVMARRNASKRVSVAGAGWNSERSRDWPSPSTSEISSGSRRSPAKPTRSPLAPVCRAYSAAAAAAAAIAPADAPPMLRSRYRSARRQMASGQIPHPG